MANGGPPDTCDSCAGKGLLNGALCSACFGQGSLPIEGFNSHFTKQLFSQLADVLDKCNDIKEKCDEIMDKLNE